jgi:hypothetical protein
LIKLFTVIEWVGPEENNLKLGNKGLVVKIKEKEVFVDWYNAAPRKMEPSGPYSIQHIKSIDE